MSRKLLKNNDIKNDKVAEKQVPPVQPTTNNELEKKSERKKKGKFKFNESIKIVLVLTIIAAISASLLALVNKYTKQDKDLVIKTKIEEKYSAKLKEKVDISSYRPTEKTVIEAYYIAENDAHIVVAKAEKSDKIAYNAAGVELIVIIKDNKIEEIHTLSHSETPGLGTKALNNDYYKQYIGVSLDRFNIDSGPVLESPSSSAFFTPKIVTSATYTSNAVHVAVKAAVRVVKTMGDN